MTENESKTVWRILVTEEMKQRWELVSEEDYSLIMAEYARLTLEEVKSVKNKVDFIQKRVNSIQGWVLFIGILMILAIVGSGCYLVAAFLNNY